MMNFIFVIKKNMFYLFIKVLIAKSIPFTKHGSKKENNKSTF